jgi:group I intron endonuclease
MISGIYRIKNKINNKIYVGSSVDIRGRFRSHRSKLVRSVHENPHIQSAWNKYGKKNFSFEIMITCHPEMLLWYEQQFIDQWNPEYNLCPTAGNCLGRKFSEETRKKIGTSQIGRKAGKRTREKMRLSHIGKNTTPKKIYKGFIDPNGVEYRNIFGLKAFCQEHNLDYNRMIKVDLGKARIHRKWRRIND